MNYRKIDKECRCLVRALNKIPGIKTIESCCGHIDREFSIWFTAKTIKNLYVIARCLDRRYCGPEGWSCIVEDTDLTERPVVFRLTSGDIRDFKACVQASLLAKAIEYILNLN